jgi:hypothetical protein
MEAKVIEQAGSRTRLAPVTLLFPLQKLLLTSGRLELGRQGHIQALLFSPW